MSDEKPQHDCAVRAMTDDGAFRVVTVRTTDTIQRMLELQSHGRTTAQHIGELMTGAVLVRETMAPDYRLQALLRSRDNDFRLVADSHPDGGSRGLLTRASSAKEHAQLSLEGGTLEIVRTLYSGELHRGVVEVPTGGTMSQTLMSYLQDSEQVASMLAVSCVLDDSGKHVIAAGGYLVQLLPEVGRGPLAIMAERLNDFRDISDLLARTNAAASPLLDEILYGFPFTRLSEHPLGWKCRCSTVRVMSSLATLSKADLTELIEDSKPIELSCDFCGQTYNISPTQLAGLMDQS
ncbi:MAG: Hsp33 family molecular chaperone HslO [Polyangiales bacterium]